MRGKGLVSKVSVRESGRTSRKPFAFFDRSLSSWKTSERSEAEELIGYSGTWPRAGMTRNGRAIERPPLAPPTTAIGGFALPLLPTPTAADGRRGPDYAKASRPGAGGDDLVTAMARLWPRDRSEKLFKTPTANLGSNGAPQHPDKRKAGGHGPTLEDEACFLVNVLPGADYGGDFSPSEWWGDFAPAVRRWEVITAQPAPVPVEYGPRGGLRLAPRFAEWLMGVNAGWVTKVDGLDRGKQLKAIGDGVVPQQAFSAFAHLLGELEKRDD